MNLSIEKKIIGNESVNSVDARELHAQMEVATEYARWIARRIEEAQLVEGVDYVGFVKFDESSKVNKKTVILCLDSAKSIAMLEHTDKGREVRKYFIECEKKLTQNQAVPYANLPQDLLVLIAMRMEIEEVKQSQSEIHKVLLTKADDSTSRLSATQVDELERLFKTFFVVCNRDGRALYKLKHRIKELFLTPPITGKTYKDMARSNFERAREEVERSIQEESCCK